MASSSYVFQGMSKKGNLLRPMSSEDNGVIQRSLRFLGYEQESLAT